MKNGITLILTEPLSEKAKDKLKDKLVIVCLSGRGDKDMIQAKSLLNFD